jgi:16S rRNA (cytosine967-C5)-methyltransferase
VDALPGFAEGEVSVQDGAAQLAACLLAPEPGMRTLDACAAPGGKTCHLLERSPDIDLTALDVAPDRLERVRENLARLRLSASLVAGDAADPAGWWDGRPFERILLDAPCSGSGVIRRHPDIKLLRRPADIGALAARQAALLDALWPLLAPGGRLLYATCSVLKAENAGQAAAFLARHPEARAVDLGEPGWGRRSGPGRQLLTGEAGVDGFYYACLLRPAQAGIDAASAAG